MVGRWQGRVEAGQEDLLETIAEEPGGGWGSDCHLGGLIWRLAKESGISIRS